jgi:hypothetical protein
MTCAALMDALRTMLTGKLIDRYDISLLTRALYVGSHGWQDLELVKVGVNVICCSVACEIYF